MVKINKDTPIFRLTVGELLNIIAEQSENTITTTVNSGNNTESSKKYVYGLRGIRQLFKVSHVTAQRYKDTIIKEAVMQQGRKIIVDADYAMKLFNERRNK